MMVMYDVCLCVFVPIMQPDEVKIVIILLFALADVFITFDLRLFLAVLRDFFMFDDNFYIFV